MRSILLGLVVPWLVSSCNNIPIHGKAPDLAVIEVLKTQQMPAYPVSPNRFQWAIPLTIRIENLGKGLISTKDTFKVAAFVIDPEGNEPTASVHFGTPAPSTVGFDHDDDPSTPDLQPPAGGNNWFRVNKAMGHHKKIQEKRTAYVVIGRSGNYKLRIVADWCPGWDVDPAKSTSNCAINEGNEDNNYLEIDFPLSLPPNIP